MPVVRRESLDIERLLGHLHSKKSWLDTVIEGLEQALQSPESRLLDAVQEAFKEGRSPRVDLPEEDESLLRALALKVPRRRNPGMEQESASGSAVEAA